MDCWGLDLNTPTRDLILKLFTSYIVLPKLICEICMCSALSYTGMAQYITMLTSLASINIGTMGVWVMTFLLIIISLVKSNNSNNFEKLDLVHFPHIQWFYSSQKLQKRHYTSLEGNLHKGHTKVCMENTVPQCS